MGAASMNATRNVLRTLAVSSAVAIGVLGVLVVPSPAAARAVAAPDGSAWLRLAHLSPGTAPVDVWLTPFGGVPGAASLHHVSYGSFSTYRSLAPGFYTVAMARGRRRLEHAGASFPDRSTSLPGRAYSVLAEDSGTTIKLHVIPDNLAAPGAGRARVRLIQASTAGQALDVSAVQGPMLVQSAAYGAVSPYTEVPQGRWTLRIASTSHAFADDVGESRRGCWDRRDAPGGQRPAGDGRAEADPRRCGPGRDFPPAVVNTGGGGLAEPAPARTPSGSTAPRGTCGRSAGGRCRPRLARPSMGRCDGPAVTAGPPPSTRTRLGRSHHGSRGRPHRRVRGRGARADGRAHRSATGRCRCGRPPPIRPDSS